MKRIGLIFDREAARRVFNAGATAHGIARMAEAEELRNLRLRALARDGCNNPESLNMSMRPEGWAPQMRGESVNHYVRNGEALCGAASVSGYTGRLYPHTNQQNKCDCRKCYASMLQNTFDLTGEQAA